LLREAFSANIVVGWSPPVTADEADDSYCAGYAR
jgi:hypothetical protein